MPLCVHWSLLSEPWFRMDVIGIYLLTVCSTLIIVNSLAILTNCGSMEGSQKGLFVLHEKNLDSDLEFKNERGEPPVNYTDYVTEKDIKLIFDFLISTLGDQPHAFSFQTNYDFALFH